MQDMGPSKGLERKSGRATGAMDDVLRPVTLAEPLTQAVEVNLFAPGRDGAGMLSVRGAGSETLLLVAEFTARDGRVHKAERLFAAVRGLHGPGLVRFVAAFDALTQERYLAAAAEGVVAGERKSTPIRVSEAEIRALVAAAGVAVGQAA